MTSFVVECLWIGVTDDDLRRVDERAAAAVEGLDSDEHHVRYHGSVLMRSDEAAAIPFERILETASSPWAVKEQ